jgi:hypothetical protein
VNHLKDENGHKSWAEVKQHSFSLRHLPVAWHLSMKIGAEVAHLFPLCHLRTFLPRQCPTTCKSILILLHTHTPSLLHAQTPSAPSWPGRPPAPPRLLTLEDDGASPSSSSAGSASRFSSASSTFSRISAQSVLSIVSRSSSGGWGVPSPSSSLSSGPIPFRTSSRASQRSTASRLSASSASDSCPGRPTRPT